MAELLKHDEWKVRAVTRNTSSPRSQALHAQGAEVVAANLEDPESLKRVVDVS